MDLLVTISYDVMTARGSSLKGLDLVLESCCSGLDMVFNGSDRVVTVWIWYRNGLWILL